MNGLKRYLGACLLVLVLGPTAGAATLYVNCGGRSGLTSIGAAVRSLQGVAAGGPNTIYVAGSCHENLVIKDMDRLTLTAVNGASITDASNGYTDVINVNDSPGFTLNGFTITAVNANNDGINCNNGSFCRLIGNAVSGGYSGIGVSPLAAAFVAGGSLEANTYGLRVLGDVVAAGVSIQGNVAGVLVQDGGKLQFRVSDPQYDGVDFALPSVSQANQQQGILAARGATVVCKGCTVSGNGADGISLDLTSSLLASPYFYNSGASASTTIAGNAGAGVRVGDLSSATFRGAAVRVAGNGQPDVACLGATSATRGATTGIGGGSTNCGN